MNRRSFLKTLAALCATPVLLKAGSALPLSEQDILTMPEEDLSSIGFFIQGMPVVHDDGTRFLGPIPSGSICKLDRMLKGTQQAAYRIAASA